MSLDMLPLPLRLPQENKIVYGSTLKVMLFRALKCWNIDQLAQVELLIMGDMGPHEIFFWQFAAQSTQVIEFVDKSIMISLTP